MLRSRTKEIVLHGADYDLRLLRSNYEFRAATNFDTVIAARLIGIRGIQVWPHWYSVL